MPANRFFLDDPLEPNTVVHLDKQEMHHASVMRMREGQVAEIINGRGTLAHATYTKAGFHIDSVETADPHPAIILCQALPRMNRLDTILEKGTEIGMSEVWLFPGDRSEKKSLSPNQLKRAEHIFISAIKQCGRLHLPKLVLKPSLKDWSKPPGLTLFGKPSGHAAAQDR